MSHEHKPQFTLRTREKRSAAAEARGIVKEKCLKAGEPPGSTGFDKPVYLIVTLTDSITGCCKRSIVPLLSVGFASLQILSTISIPSVTYPKAAY